MGTFQEEFGKNFRELRKAKKLSQGELAERIGMASTYVSSLEAGKVNLTFVTVEKLAQGLGIELPEIFTFLYAKNPTPKEIRKNLIAAIEGTDDKVINTIYDMLMSPYKQK